MAEGRTSRHQASPTHDNAVVALLHNMEIYITLLTRRFRAISGRIGQAKIDEHHLIGDLLVPSSHVRRELTVELSITGQGSYKRSLIVRATRQRSPTQACPLGNRIASLEEILCRARQFVELMRASTTFSDES